jgi:hypothetical protein
MGWFGDEAYSPRRLAAREGWRYQHVHAIIVAMNQYAEAATGNRDIFLNKPPKLGGWGEERRGASASLRCTGVDFDLAD